MRKTLLLAVIVPTLMIASGCASTPLQMTIDPKQSDRVTGSQALGHYDNKSDTDKVMARLKNRGDVIQTFSPPTLQAPIKQAPINIKQREGENLRSSCDVWTTAMGVYIPSDVLNASEYGTGAESLVFWVCYTKDDAINNYSWQHVYMLMKKSGGRVTMSEEDMNKMPDAYVKYQKFIDYMVSRKHQLLGQGS